MCLRDGCTACAGLTSLPAGSSDRGRARRDHAGGHIPRGRGSAGVVCVLPRRPDSSETWGVEEAGARMLDRQRTACGWNAGVRTSRNSHRRERAPVRTLSTTLQSEAIATGWFPVTPTALATPSHGSATHRSLSELPSITRPKCSPLLSSCLTSRRPASPVDEPSGTCRGRQADRSGGRCRRLDRGPRRPHRIWVAISHRRFQSRLG